MTTRIDYDEIIGAVYITITDKEIVRTADMSYGTKTINIDLDANDEVVGVEVL